MIARFRVLLPFSISVRHEDKLQAYEFDRDGYHVRVFPPYQAGLDPLKVGVSPLADNIEGLKPADPQTPMETIRLDSSATIRANCLQIDFLKPSFDRRPTETLTMADPPGPFLFEITNDFMTRYRSAGRVPAVHLLTPLTTFWNLRYLTDDEEQLPADPALQRGFGSSYSPFRLSGLNEAVWKQTWTLPADFKPHAWEWLLLDAESLLPEVGPSIMIAYSALETFITWALDQLALRSGLIPAELWKWITDRGGRHELEPSVVDLFDVFLKVLAGRSLKEDTKLWESFQSLRKARNNFAHEGKPVLGSLEVTAQRAMEFVAEAKGIVDWVENLLPDDLRRPRPVSVQWQINLMF